MQFDQHYQEKKLHILFIYLGQDICGYFDRIAHVIIQETSAYVLDIL